MRSRGSSTRPAPSPGPIEAYLARGPERDPRVLVPRSALALLRAAYLFHGVVVRGWSLGWLAAFLFAEFFVVARLSVLGDRLATGSALDPELHRRTSWTLQLAWLVVSTAALVATGLALAASQAGEPVTSLADLGRMAGEATAVWGVAGYATLLFADFVAESLTARRECRAFTSAATLQAGFFFVVVVALSFFSIALAALVEGALGDRGARGTFALHLVASRAIADLAVLWLPRWAPRLAAWKRRESS